MGKLDKMPRYRNSTPITWHDMSYDFKFTAANGHLNPVLSDLLLPGDKVSLQSTYVVRVAQPLLAAAMVDIDFHVETFFVPMTMIWSPFEDWIYNVNNYYSSFAQGNLIFPTFNMALMKNGVMANINSIDTHVSYESYGQRYVRLASMLGYNPYISHNTSSIVDSFAAGNEGLIRGYMPPIFPYAALAYQCVWQNYYRLDERTRFAPTTFNVDGRTTNISNLEPFLIQYRPNYMDYFTSIKLSPLLNEKNLRSTDIGSLLNVYQDYGNNYIQKSFLGPSYPSYGYKNVSSQSADSGLADGTNLGLDTESTFQSPVGLYNSTPIKQDPLGVRNAGDYDEEISSMFSASSLRTLFANEKLLMVTARARKNYDAQTLAHFGVKVPHDVKHEISFLGSDTFRLSINEMVSTADTKQTSGGTTTGASLGEYFGKGMAGNEGKVVKFRAPCHGVLLQLFSIVPHYDYIVPFLKKHYIQSRLDFFQPEYDNLGMQPVYRYEMFSAVNLVTSSRPSVEQMYQKRALPEEWMFDIQGWQYRYEQYKRNFNRATIAFERDSVYGAWALTRKPLCPLLSRWNDLEFSGNGRMYGPASTAYEIEWRDYYTDNSFIFYAQPSDLDSLFAVSYPLLWNDTWNTNNSLVFYYDPFVVNSRFNYKKGSIMSTYSMPKFD